MYFRAMRRAAVSQPALALILIIAALLANGIGCVAQAAESGAAPLANVPDPNQRPDMQSDPGVESDPLAPFNEAMFTFNRKLDDWVLHPVASGYAYVTPEQARQAVGRFLDNVDVIPRFMNNLFQLRLAEAGGEVARLGINSTLGLAGLFDPADHWFGLKEHPDDFGLTLRYYGVPTGPYLMLPFFGPSTIGDTVGLVVDGSMNPLDYLTPWYVYLSANSGYYLAYEVNYRSLHLGQFEEADRYAVDLYGAVQDAYRQIRAHRLKELKQQN